ncbi:uncharacterized protein N7469_003627 [Penicillium citrinum]|uniref:Hepatocellular carcinoma-associated antigen 59-domain-containing protein n=2 Tax=Penicillium TaxID=5073 RepID=A0A9W9TRJ3_PENCI|nr:uncharacterized protein N7469_003627 [Penicillium citrinum]KAJ5234459.1 hypothetical protein N7469_003627 [Penicillium citrinum]KAJ5590079.1 hypothetical protein N7450_004051 [Penicillium hetheringtonii]
MEDVDINPESLFRPTKRRKFIRRRQDDAPEDSESMVATGAKDQGQAKQDHDEATLQFSDIARIRRPNPARKGGIGFSTTSRSSRDGSRQTTVATAEDREKERVQAMADRFTGNSGQTVDVNRHMMAYIDSEMAKRYRRSPQPENDEDKQLDSIQIAEKPSIPGQPLERQPASLGRLHEIDLGEEAKLRNIARTEAATRKLTDDEPRGIGEPQANRTGTEEKAWRNRKRRTSADIERDRLVEEVLRESKLDVYDEPEDETQLDDQAADDRVAEQFRRDFMDAIQSRRRQRTNTKPANNNKVEPPKGPKLGGSRSARAAMREMQTKK